MLNPDLPWLCKQCRYRPVGFRKSQLIETCTLCHSVCEFMSTIWIKESDWLTIRRWCGILIYSAWQGLTNNVTMMTVKNLTLANGALIIIVKKLSSCFSSNAGVSILATNLSQTKIKWKINYKYCIYPKYWDTFTTYLACSKIWMVYFTTC